MDESYQPQFYDVDDEPHGPRWLFVLLALVVVAGLAVGGVWFWLHRDVRVTINGRSVDIMYHSSLEDIYVASGVVPMPGDLYSIGGNLLEAGGGEKYSVVLNGTPLSDAEQQAYRIEGYESISIRDGGDVTEDSEVVERVVSPLLVPPDRVRAVTFVRLWGVPGVSRVQVGSVSGEEILVEVVQEPQDCILDSVNPVPSDGRKVVVLTFDDGPSSYTADILAILKEKGVRATFFCLGSSVESWPETTAAIEAAGCEVMSHTMNHWNHYATTQEETYAETAEAFQVLCDDAGVYTTVIRPPYGNWNEYCWRSSGGTMSASVIWNIDSLDWELPGAEAIVANCTTGVSSGDIILMHDGGGDRSQDIEALPQIIDNLREQGFEFITVSELMSSDYRIPEEVARQYAPMPEGYEWPTEVAE